MLQEKKYKAIVHEAEEGGYWAEVVELPGCVTEGDTLDELNANLQEAVSGWLISQKIRDKEDAGIASSSPVKILEFA